MGAGWSEGNWKYLMKYLSDNGKDAKKEMQTLLSNNGINGTDEEIKTNYTKSISRERVAPTDSITRVEAIALIDRFSTVIELGVIYGN